MIIKLITSYSHWPFFHFSFLYDNFIGIRYKCVRKVTARLYYFRGLKHFLCPTLVHYIFLVSSPSWKFTIHLKPVQFSFLSVLYFQGCENSENEILGNEIRTERISICVKADKKIINLFLKGLNTIAVCVLKLGKILFRYFRSRFHLRFSRDRKSVV